MGDQRTELIKKLLIKFKKPFSLNSEDSPDFDDFFKLIDLNSQLANPKTLCLNCWSLLNESQTRDHKNFFGHTVLNSDSFPSKEQFLVVAKDNGKCTTNEMGQVVYLTTPTSAPQAMTNQNADSQISMQSQNSQLNNGAGMRSYQNFRGDAANPGNQIQQNIVQNGNGVGPALNGFQGPQMNPNGGFQQNEEQYQKDDFGDEISVMNSYADNMAYVDSLNREERYAQKAKAMFDDDGSGNTGIEIIRLNKKFDIFMKRFMRAEEDIKEVKQNFYRVMHCAFAKYEQGFKRKNEYLERRRVKRREEIDRGVQQELKKRGMTGELDDPLLMNSVAGGRVDAYTGAGHQGGHNYGMNPEDSSIGINNMAGEESSLSIKNLGNNNNGMGFDDSELTTNNIVGISSGGNKKHDSSKSGGAILSKDKGKKDKKKGDKKKKKKKDRDSSDDDEKKEPSKPQRASNRLARGLPEETNMTDLNSIQ
ncbi:UNKNOWN [Stylonychia lemnae]|uniref:Uncharacterized protein n=1 Tax=Stylonychia lemnae TaxID=5949 RepID=A0A078B8Q0_STYLE|nr:UNKNOWN [Stylonychia lemnae]|eukprot:CDW89903.1 UNKNOWN [Stylonychia lemnae]